MLILVFEMLFGAHALPEPVASPPVRLPHFPDRVHAFVWKNWQLVPAEKMALVLGTTPENVVGLGRSMGLSGPPEITEEQQRRSYITVIRRNWHLLPYDQLMQLLGWSEEQLAFTLREDDFLSVKLGAKPDCAPLLYVAPDEAVLDKERHTAAVVREEFPDGVGELGEPLFAFVQKLSEPLPSGKTPRMHKNRFTRRYCYSYFALYGDPLYAENIDPYPDGLLERLAASGVNGVWLQGLLAKLAPFPWDSRLSEGYEKRLARLRELVARAKRHGIGVYLYLNEPRSLPVSFFEKYPQFMGVREDGFAALCTSVPEIQQYITDSVSTICSAVPDLAGLFTITASENLTNCWSHQRGMECPRCGKRPAWEVIAEVNALIKRGIEKSGAATELIAWDWGWQDDWAAEAIGALPEGLGFMSVSEWSLPISRGGIESTVGEYSISAIGPGPRAQRHWGLARSRGLKTFAKIQAGNTWELSAVPYIPAVWNVARHAENLRHSQVDGLMLGWTLGGYPSPNLEVVAEIGKDESITALDAMNRVASRRFGKKISPAVVEAWQQFSTAFSEFPFHIGVVYTAPLQTGPANPLWESPTGYRATMCGFPYDDLDSWRVIYPADVFANQLEKVAQGFENALTELRTRMGSVDVRRSAHREAIESECRIAEAAALHFRSAANQARFVAARRALDQAQTPEVAAPLLTELERILRDEIDVAKRLYAIQICDSRIGFEATNHYFYVPIDLVEKVVNCRDLLDRWLPQQHVRFQASPSG
ncbi:MAG TPA: hypothetical protein PKY35_04580 [Candidatus Hydrogenedentes bacterium]|nr:hypothetical protein [Candidatus Hydrogenedentota bacterium]HOL76284.1 hypothetical protein [Candidatus Hydrogenedentota bacterium]HPO86111.1 hypothetical protein [Candidatus Hydrogenedentota bacterium]